MKATSEHLNLYRIKHGAMMSDDTAGLMGSFVIPTKNPSRSLWVISSGPNADNGWEHVSAHIKERVSKKRVKADTPTWDEMCLLKSLFWRHDECCVQYHPPLTDYVNVHEWVLHLWKPCKANFTMPDVELV